MRHPRPDIGRPNRAKARHAKCVSLMLLHELQKPENVRAISLNRVLRPTFDTREVLQPALKRIGNARGNHPSQRRMARSKTPPMKLRRSVP